MTEEVNLENKDETVTKVAYPAPKEEHTKKNTCVGVPLSIKWVYKVDNDYGYPTIPVFLGTKKDDYRRNLKLVSLWVALKTAEEGYNNGKVSEESLNPIRNAYDDYVKEFYGNMDEDQLLTFIESFMRFNQDNVEEFSFRSENNYNPNLTNQTMFAEGIVESDCVGRIPGNAKGNSFADKMIRASYKQSRTPVSYDVLVRDSLVQLRLKRTDLMEVGDMINAINNEVKGYVRTINGNSLTLSRVPIYRIFWDHVLSKVESCSVKGITDFRNLGNIIKFNTLNEIFIKFLIETCKNGVNFTLFCSKLGCNWSETQAIDPSLLKFHDSSKFNSNQLAMLGNIRNQVKTYSREEILKAQDEFEYLKDNKIYFDDKKQYVVIKPATVNETLTFFDAFMLHMEPRIVQIREQYIDDQQYHQELEMLLDTYRAMEYIHWISELHITGDLDEEEKVYRMSDDPAGFSEAIINIINNPENPELGKELIKKVSLKAGDFSSVVIGVPNFSCPKCKTLSGDELTSVDGITPIDIFSCFFIQSRFEHIKRQQQLAMADDLL